MGGVAGPVLFGLAFENFFLLGSGTFEFPRLQHRGRVFSVLYITTSFKDEGLEPFFAELFGRPASTYSRSYYDSIVSILCSSFTLYIQ